MRFLIFSLAGLLAFFGFDQRENVPAPFPDAFKPLAACDALTGVEKLVCLADEFKATLSASQITTLQLGYNLTNAAKWSNLPVTFVPRLGIRFGDLNTAQLAAAKALVKAATGTNLPEGYEEMVQLWAADQYLLNNGGGSAYGEGQYFMAFLGNPSLTGTWELQAGGHHVALSNTYANGLLTGATPSFRAVEPFDAFAGSGGTYQPMLQERDALAAMLAALSTSELASAKLTATYMDVTLGPGKDWQFPAAKSGLQCGTLNAAQKALVLAAIQTYVEDIDDENAAKIMALYTAGLNETHIAFSGNANLLNQRDYVRIDGPRVWIEYSTQNGIVLSPKHPHSVWRDHQSDYGGLGGPAVGTVAAAAVPFSGKFQIFPNPAPAAAQVAIELEKAATVSLSVFDSAGRKVSGGFRFSVTAGSHALPLDLVQLPKGHYNCVLEVKNGDGQTAVASRPLAKI